MSTPKKRTIGETRRCFNFKEKGLQFGEFPELNNIPSAFYEMTKRSNLEQKIKLKKTKKNNQIVTVFSFGEFNVDA
jgi:hypothetical protein